MSDREPEPPPEDAPAPGGELVLAEEGGVRVFYIAAPTMQDLVDRLALVLGEHMHDDDELHVTYNAMQSGWTEHPAEEGPRAARARAGLDRAALRVLGVRRAARPRSAILIDTVTGLGDGELLVVRAEDLQTLAVAAALARALDTDLRIAGPRPAAAKRASLIIVGPHGRGPRRTDALDPLTRSILRDAKVPVMMLPAHLAAVTQHAVATGAD